jgi:hypothetical protein
VFHLINVIAKMDILELSVNIQFVTQNHQTIYYLVLELKTENVFLQIIVLVIQDIIHLIVHYIIVMVKFIMIQQFVLEMVSVFQLKLVLVIMDGLTKIVKLQFVI